jgi:hypothetical protein
MAARRLAAQRRQIASLPLVELMGLFQRWVRLPKNFGGQGRKRLFSPR